MTDLLRQCWTGVRALVVLTAILGIAYPAAIWGTGRLAFHDLAQGSLIVQNGTVVGSRLLGQTFQGDRWFLPRPSANDYDALASGGSNAGPSSVELLAEIAERRQTVASREHVAPSAVPADAVTASGSGLDRFISPDYARIQIPRVAAARGLSTAQVGALVAEHTDGRMFGFLGEPRVNVTELNLALAER